MLICFCFLQSYRCRISSGLCYYLNEMKRAYKTIYQTSAPSLESGSKKKNPTWQRHVRLEYQCPLMECQSPEVAGFEILNIVDIRAHKSPHQPPSHQHELLLTAFFSGVPVGEVADSRFSRFISLLLGSLRVLFSSLMLAWCFSRKSCDLSRNLRRMCRGWETRRGEKGKGDCISRTSTSLSAAAVPTSTHLICMTKRDVRQYGRCAGEDGMWSAYNYLNKRICWCFTSLCRGKWREMTFRMLLKLAENKSNYTDDWMSSLDRNKHDNHGTHSKVDDEETSVLSLLTFLDD